MHEPIRTSTYYRTEDPLENLQLRIVIYEISKPRSYEDTQARTQPFQYSRIINWQEKLFSPSEILDYITHKESKKGSAAQLENRRLLERMERNSEKDAPFKAADILSEQMVYTYIDKDHYAANTDSPLRSAANSAGAGLEPYLGAACSSMGVQYSRMSREKDLAE
eukprot:gene3024-4125_t